MCFCIALGPDGHACLPVCWSSCPPPPPALQGHLWHMGWGYFGEFIVIVGYTNDSSKFEFCYFICSIQDSYRKIELNNVFFPISSSRDSLAYMNINEHFCIISTFYTYTHVWCVYLNTSCVCEWVCPLLTVVGVYLHGHLHYHTNVCLAFHQADVPCFDWLYLLVDVGHLQVLRCEWSHPQYPSLNSLFTVSHTRQKISQVFAHFHRSEALCSAAAQEGSTCALYELGHHCA